MRDSVADRDEAREVVAWVEEERRVAGRELGVLCNVGGRGCQGVGSKRVTH
jgi:hypothetical protein